MTLSIPAEKMIWQKVLERAVLDAITPVSPRSGRETIRCHDQADAWIKGAGRDYQMVCALAGIDAEMVRKHYIHGNINIDTLRSAGEVRRARA